MSIASGLAVALLAAALAGAATAPPAPQAISASYDVYLYGARIATMNETFEAAQGEYRLVSESRPIGVVGLFQKQPVRFTSAGRLTAAGLEPQRFEGNRGENDPRRVRGEFDWKAGRLTIEHHGRTETLPLPRGTQDRLSVMYQFMFLAPGKQQHLEVSMTNGRKLDRYQYSVEQGVEIDTGLGRMTTVHLVKQRQPDESATEIWLSPRHRYLPVRMMIVERNGSRYEQIITKLEIKP